ncbi:MAG: hypothetical protein JWO89_2300 [Verrucomicrobiaceae bacterium]|nr:hypothetical protein [Verrucomicrobiaceae bacterium]
MVLNVAVCTLVFIAMVGLTGWLRTRAQCRDCPTDLYLNPHEAGWTVLFDEEIIGELEYKKKEWPFFYFLFIQKTRDDAKIEHVFRNAKRSADPKIEFQNRLHGGIAVEGDFLFGLEGSEVSLRDFRA